MRSDNIIMKLFYEIRSRFFWHSFLVDHGPIYKFGDPGHIYLRGGGEMLAQMLTVVLSNKKYIIESSTY